VIRYLRLFAAPDKGHSEQCSGENARKLQRVG
jgi:hypothetical protein